jgi:sulfur-oxidizing protein SoxX
MAKTNSTMLRLIHHWIAFTARHPQAAGAFIITSKIRRMTMRKLHQVATACAICAIMLSGSVLAQTAAAPKKEVTGKNLAYDKKKGNCLACHAMPTQADAESAGMYGPPLIAMSARFPDKAKLRAQIWDATVANPASSMIPFGKHGVMTEAEIDKVTDFVYGL